MISLNGIAEAGQTRHHDFTSLLLQDAIESDLPSPYAALLKRGVAYIEEERATTFQVSGEISYAATKAVNGFFGTDVPSAYVAPVDTFIPLISLQASDDIKNVMSHAVAVLSQRKLIASSNKRMSRAQVNKLAEERSPFVSYFTDKSGKRWNGDTYVRTLWRQFSVDALANATVAALLANKQTTAKLVTTAPGKPGNNLVFSITNDFSLPNWEEVRVKYFHPNSSILVAPVGADNGFSI